MVNEKGTRVLALDVGGRRIGVAVSDPLRILARSVGVVEYKSTAEGVAAVVDLVREWDVSTIVVGDPRSMDGTIGQQAREVEAFVAELEQALRVSVVLWDERLSTVSAARFLHEQGLDARAQRSRIDAAAAAVILQDYLNSRHIAEEAREGEHDET